MVTKWVSIRPKPVVSSVQVFFGSAPNVFLKRRPGLERPQLDGAKHPEDLAESLDESFLRGRFSAGASTSAGLQMEWEGRMDESKG